MKCFSWCGRDELPAIRVLPPFRTPRDSDAGTPQQDLTERQASHTRRARNVQSRLYTFSAAAVDDADLPTPIAQPESGERRLIVYLVRHAEAIHNVEEKRVQKKADAEGWAHEQAEKARKGVLQNPAFLDARLSTSGEKQVLTASSGFQELLEKTHYPEPKTVFVSPLERTLQTASLLFPEHPMTVAKEFLREKRTGLPCDERKHVSELAADFPHVNFSDIVEKDDQTRDGYEFKPELLEGNEELALRCEQLLGFLQGRAEASIAVVTHKGFLRELHKGPWRDVLDNEAKLLPTTFGNAEVRVCQLTWTYDGFQFSKPLVEALPMELAVRYPRMRTLTKKLTMKLPSLSSMSSMPLMSPSTPCNPCMGVGVSLEDDAAEATAEAWCDMQEQLSGSPDFALVYCTSEMEGEVVASTLQKYAGACLVMGGTSAVGVLTSSGLHKVGVLGFRGTTQRCSVGSAGGATCAASAHKAGADAARKACMARSELPDLILLCAAPGWEESVLEGITEVCGQVPIFGGSASDDSLADTRGCSQWWQLFGQGETWGTHTDGVVVGALWLHKVCCVSGHLSHCCAPMGHSGLITEASDRMLQKIDGKPAAEVLNEWLEGALQERLAGGSLLNEMSCYPLALESSESPDLPMTLVRARCVLGQGQVECFGRVTCGRVRLLRTKASDVSGAAVELARQAVAEAGFQVRMALVVFGASVSVLSDANGLAEALKKELNGFLCIFTYGQQGMIGPTVHHGSLMMNLLLCGHK